MFKAYISLKDDLYWFDEAIIDWMLFLLVGARQNSSWCQTSKYRKYNKPLNWKNGDGYSVYILYLTFIFLHFRFRKLVLIAIQDEGSRNMNNAAYNALITLGAINPLKKNIRSSYAQIGWTGPGQIDVIGQVRAPTMWILIC